MVGTLDVDGMLDSITPEQFDEFIAFNRVEPCGSDSTVEVLATFAASVARMMGNDEVTPEMFAPWRLKPVEKKASPKAVRSLLEGLARGGTRRHGGNAGGEHNAVQ